MTREERQHAREAFFHMVRHLEDVEGQEATLVTSIALLAIALARQHGQPKPTVAADGNYQAALRDAIDRAWPDFEEVDPEELELAIECYRDHIASHGIGMDLGIYGPAHKV